MNCPKCNNDSGGIVYQDCITCDKCGNHIVVDYYVCHVCGYSWRLNNGEFLDVQNIDHEGLDQMLDEIEVLIKEEFGDESLEVDIKSESNTNSSMFDILHKCIRCGQIAYDNGNNSFTCESCGFQWEVLEGVQ